MLASEDHCWLAKSSTRGNPRKVYGL